MKNLQVLAITVLIALSICALAAIQVRAQGTVSYLIVSSGPSQSAGLPFTFTVTAYNSDGTVATGYTDTVTFTSSDLGKGAVLPPDYNFTAADAGVASFSATLVTAGIQSIIATDTSNSSINGLQSGIQVNPGALNHFGISVPSSVTAGSSFGGVTVTAYDAYNNVIANYADSIYFTSSDPAATLPYTSLGEYPFVSNDSGSHTFSGFTLDSASSQTITVTDGALPTQSTSITVNVGSVSKFVVGSPASATAGTGFTLTVTAEDAYGNIVTNYTGPAGLSASSGTIAPTTTGTSGWTSGVWSSPVTLTTAGTIIVTVDDGKGQTGTASVTISAGPLATVTVSGPSSVTAGGTATFSASGYDAEGNSLGVQTAAWSITPGAAGSWSSDIYTSYTTGSWTITATVLGFAGTAPLTVTEGALATLSITGPSSVIAGADATFTATGYDAESNSLGVEAASWSISSGANGSWVQSTSTYTSDIAGAWTVSALVSGVTGTASLAVNSGPANSLVVSGFPTPDVAGSAHTVTVTAFDAYGNVATGYIGTIKITSSDGEAVLPVNAGLSNGAGPFSITLETAGPQSITATDTVTNSIAGSQTGITVDAGALATVTVSGPTSVTAGATAAFTATGYDAESNSLGAQTASWGITNGAGGSWVQSTGVYTSQTTGSWTVQASVSSVVGTASLTVNPGVAARLAVSCETSQIAGTPFTVTVTAVDAYGNTAKEYAGTIHFSSSDSGSGVSLPSDYTFQSDDLGTHTFFDNVTLITIGTQSITATDTVSNSLTGSQTSITVTVALGIHFVVSGFTSPATAGVASAVTVTAKDLYGNVDANYTGTVSITSSDSKAILPSNTTLTLGIGAFTVTLETAGTQSITATDTTNSTISGTETGISVAHTAVAQVVISPADSSITAGESLICFATASDVYGNTWNVTSTTTWGINSQAGGSWSNNVYTSEKAGFWNVTGTINDVPYITGLTVNPASMDHFAFNTVATQTAGSGFSITITALDAYGNTVTGYSGTPALSVSNGTIAPTVTGVFSSGVWTGIINLTAPSLDVTIKAADSSYSGVSTPFAINPTIFASAGLGGSISPTGSITVNYGGSQEFNISANAGYSVADVLVNGASVGAVSSYTFSNVEDEYNISSTFVSTPTSTPVPTPLPSTSPQPTASPEPTTRPMPTGTPGVPVPTTHKPTSLPTIGPSLEVVLVVLTTTAGIIIVMTVIVVVRLGRKPKET